MRFRLILAACAAACVHTSAALAQERTLSRTGMERVSAEVSRSYLRTWSSDSRTAVAAVPRIYAPRVRFYGRVLDRQKLAGEKRRFVQRWPVRSYAHRPGTLRVACARGAPLCTVRSVMDWTTENRARGAAASGAARFEQGIDFSGARPLVVLETGSVIRRARGS